MKTLRRIAVLAAVVALLAAPATAQVKDWKKIKYPKLPDIEVPKPEVYTLDNGLRVFLLEDHELPLVEASALIRMGSAWEPAEKTGLASIYGQVLREGGTTERAPDEIDEWLAARAASIETFVGDDAGRASIDTLAEDFPDVLRLFREMLVSPAFAEDKIDLAKTQEKTNIARRNDDVGEITGREFRRLVRGEDSPLARNVEYATLAAIGRDDLVAWHDRYVHPNNMMLGVVGDFDTAAMKKLIQDVFGGWERGPDADLGSVAYREEPRPGLFFIEKDDVTQVNLRLGHLGILRENPDYFAVQILNEVMSGGFTSRLFGTIRTDMGLAYSVSGSVGSDYMWPGLFQAGMQTKSGNLSEALGALEDVLAGMISNPPTDEEIARAKDAILQSFVFNYTSRAQILFQQMSYAYYGLPADYLEQYRANIDKVTGQQVAEAAKKYIHPDRFTVLVVGNPADFDKPLSDIAPFETVDISIPPPPDTGPAVVRTAATLEKGAAVLGRMAATMGAGDPSSIRGYRVKTSMTISMQGQALPVQQTQVAVFPDRTRTEMSIMGNKQTVVIAGDGGFMMGGGQVQDLPGQVVGRQKESLHRDLLYLAKHAGDAEAVFVDASSVDGTACDLVAVTLEGTESNLCVDDGGRVLQTSYQGANPLTQAPGRITTNYSDFREVSGVPFAHALSVLFEGEEFMNGTVEEFVLNPEVDAAAFEKPAP